MNENFLTGIVEGFYGPPWTRDQRLILLEQMAEWGLNTYFYSPKDDLKHRAIWRELYNEEELSTLAGVIDACEQHGLHFVYGLSPGLDIQFSNPEEIENVKLRFNQLIEVGARDFALLFDDLPGKMTDEDLKAFDSVAAAQCSVANSVFSWLREQFTCSRLLFCPTPYCDRMDRWKLGGEGYLDVIGQSLVEDIDVLWTGPEIISREISADSIGKLTSRIGRAPVIWDNLHANDYDMRRLYCGPYSGRSAKLLKSVSGVLANPNNEFWMNFVPLRTMADFFHNPANYQPRDAFVDAVAEWAPHFETVKDQMCVEDVQLLADCYYLPHEDGHAAAKLKSLVTDLIRIPAESWGTKHAEFLDYHSRIDRLFGSFTQLKNRELFYAWSRRVWELREEMDLIRDYLDWKRSGGDEVAGFVSETHLSRTCRGGIVADLQRLISMDDNGHFRAK